MRLFILILVVSCSDYRQSSISCVETNAPLIYSMIDEHINGLDKMQEIENRINQCGVDSPFPQDIIAYRNCELRKVCTPQEQQVVNNNFNI